MQKIKNLTNYLMDNNTVFSLNSARSHVHINHVELDYPGPFSEVDIFVTEEMSFLSVDMKKAIAALENLQNSEAIMFEMQSLSPRYLDAFFDLVGMTAGKYLPSEEKPASVLGDAEDFLNQLNNYLPGAIEAVEKKNAMARFNLLEPLQ